MAEHLDRVQKLIGKTAPIGRRAMKYAYLLVVFSVTMAVAIWLIGLDVSNVYYHWILESLFSFIPLAWILTTVLIGVTAPEGRNTIAYGVLVVLPLIIAGSIMASLLSIAVLFTLPYYIVVSGIRLYPDWFIVGGIATFYWLMLASLIGAVGMRTELADKPRTPSLYIIVTLCSLGISAAVIALSVTIFYAQFLGEHTSVEEYIMSASYISFLFILAVSPILGTFLISKMRHFCQNIVVGGIGLGVMIMAVVLIW